MNCRTLSHGLGLTLALLLLAACSAPLTISPLAASVGTATPASPTATPTPALPVASQPEPKFEVFFIFAPQGCGNCARQAPIMERFHRHATPGVRIVGVPIPSWGGDDAAVVSRFVAEHEITFEVAGHPEVLESVGSGRHPLVAFRRGQPDAPYVVASAGVIPEAELTAQFERFAEGEPISVYRGGT